MSWLDSDNCYGRVSRLLHWVMALLLLVMLTSEGWMEAFEHMAGNPGMQIHQSIGTLLLALLVFRLIWRRVNLGRVQPLQHWRTAARLGHLALYSLMLVIPLSGLATAWGSGHGVELFGVELLAPGRETEWLEEAGEDTHEVLASLLWLVMAGHILATLAHQHLTGDGILRRMA